MLEGSGVFATYKLQTNFRSNQEILDFANVLLANIEANQYAQIQLHANDLSPVTEDSFTEKVNLHYERVDKLREFDEYMGSVLSAHAHKYIEDCLARGEQVACLAYTRSAVKAMGDYVEKNFPGKVIADIMPDKTYDTTTFSTFIKKFWDQVAQAPTSRPIDSIIQDMILGNIEHLTKWADSARPNIVKNIEAWRTENGADIAMWQAHYLAGTLTQTEFLDQVKRSMIDFEIQHNAIKSSLTSARNKQAKLEQADTKADIILSTIHSAKGLEFDNTVVIYQDHKDDDEEKKRMYYVALTRAKKSELVIAYGTKAKPRITLDYQSIVTSLQEKDAMRAGIAANAADGAEAQIS